MVESRPVATSRFELVSMSWLDNTGFKANQTSKDNAHSDILQSSVVSWGDLDEHTYVRLAT